VEDLRRFFDHYLKGEDNGWETTPRVRYSILDLEGGDQVGVPADTFPPADVTSTRFYLDARSRSLNTTAPSEEATAVYAVDSNPSTVSFITRFDVETVLVGHPKAHVWVEARGADDVDLFVLVQKLDAHGTPLAAFTVPNTSAMAHDLTDHGATVPRYKGSDGRLRASARHLVTSMRRCPPRTSRRTVSTGSSSSPRVRSSTSRSTCSPSAWRSTPESSSGSSSAPATCWGR